MVELYSYSQGSGVARLSVGFNPQGTGAGGERIRQSENYLDKVSVRDTYDGFSRRVVDLVVSVNEIHYYRRSNFTLAQLKIPHEDNYSRVLIASKLERIRGVKDRKRISEKENGM
jgi:hypothetical protein